MDTIATTTTGLTLAPSVSPEERTAESPSVPLSSEPPPAQPVAPTNAIAPVLKTASICSTVAFLGWCGTMIVLSQGPEGVKAMRAMGDATSKSLGALTPVPRWLASLKR